MCEMCNDSSIWDNKGIALQTKYQVILLVCNDSAIWNNSYVECVEMC